MGLVRIVRTCWVSGGGRSPGRRLNFWLGKQKGVIVTVIRELGREQICCGVKQKLLLGFDKCEIPVSSPVALTY